MKRIFFIMAMSLIYSAVSANNVQVTNLVKTGNVLTFNLSWENSWRSSLTYHDAVWVFIKQAPNGGPSWEHAKVSDAMAGAGYLAVLPGDQVGFFVRRTGNGNGTVSTQVSATLIGLNGIFQDVKVMAIEMVYVPTGDFYAGDGASTQGIARGDDASQSVHITQTTTLTCGSTSDDIQFTHSAPCSNIPPSFPLGYDEFYCMKYVVTQGQYVDFLNCLSRTQQENRVTADVTGTTVANVFVLADDTTPNDGNVVRCDASIGTGNITFYCDRNNNGIPNEADDGLSRACNYLSITDWMAYMDWAGLRPWSFLEVEKASRGPMAPVAHEKSWGSTLCSANGTLVNAGLATERWSNSKVDGGISTYSDNVIRVGCNAPSSSATRELSNASFYGIIDIGNNPGDYYIHPEHIGDFLQVEGDGTLNSAGEANVAYWPTIDPTTYQKSKLPLCSTGISNMSVSSPGHSAFGGGRGVRSFF